MTQDSKLIQHIRAGDCVGRSFSTSLLAFAPVTMLYFAALAFGLFDYAWLQTITNWRIPNQTLNAFLGVVGDVVLTPLVETALMLIPIRAARWLGIRESWLPCTSGMVWALLHARNGQWIRLVTFWPFFLFTKQFLREEPRGLDRAWCLVAVSHGTYNGLVLLWVLVVRQLVE